MASNHLTCLARTVDSSAVMKTNLPKTNTNTLDWRTETETTTTGFKTKTPWDKRLTSQIAGIQPPYWHLQRSSLPEMWSPQLAAALLSSMCQQVYIILLYLFGANLSNESTVNVTVNIYLIYTNPHLPQRNGKGNNPILDASCRPQPIPVSHWWQL